MVTDLCVDWAEAALQAGQGDGPAGPEALAQLTLIVPSFRRQDYLMRQAVYWAHSRATLIIVDGSPDPIGPRAESLLRRVPNVSYVHSDVPYVDRIRQASDRVSTPYAMCLADDDLYLMTGLGHAIDCLHVRPELTICVGQAVAVDFDRWAARATFFSYGSSLRGYEVVHADPAERIRRGMDHYRSATSYAVVRSPAFAEIWRGIELTSCSYVVEYEHAISSYAVGSLAAVDDIYWLRSWECETIMPLAPDFVTWWSAPEYRDECAAFVDRQAAKLVRHSSLTAAEARAVVLEAVDFIAKDRHTGLMDQGCAMKMAGRMLRRIQASSALASFWTRFKATRAGGRLRNLIMARLRGALDTPAAAALPGLNADAARELGGVLAFMAEFHAARQVLVEG